MLREVGHEVYTPTLSGQGERSHLVSQSINLDTHIQDIVSVFHHENLSDVILCGHSYGGMVITGVANEIAGQIRSLVYIDAYAPADGQSLLDIAGPEGALAFLARAAATGDLIPPHPASAFNVNEADAAWVDKLSLPQPLATFVQAARGGVEAIPVSALKRIYIFAAANGGDWFVSTYERLKEQPEWQVQAINCGHQIMLDRPRELLSILLSEAPR